MGTPFDRIVPAGPSFYVDPTGSDSNPGTLVRPWRTLDGARLNLRAAGGLNTANGPTTVIVNPGDYSSGSTLAFGTGDSGSAWPVIWKSPTAGAAKISGGRVLSGWSLFSGSIYRVAVSGRVTTLWENGVRAREARFPAFSLDASHVLAQPTYLTAAGVSGSNLVLQYAPGDLTPGGWDLNSTRIAVWPGGLSVSGGARAWFEDHIPIASVNVGAKQITLSATAIYNVSDGGAGGRYYAEGDISFLVGPGQWYHDATNGFLYYWPIATPIASQTIVIPAMDNVVQFIGDTPAAPCANVLLDGFEIQYSDSVYTYQVSNWANRLKGTVFMQNTRGVGLNRCNIHNSGLNGVFMHSANRSCFVTNSWVHNTAGYGILVENYPTISPDIGDVNGTHAIRNCKVNDSGEIFGESNNIYIVNAGSNLVDHCELYNATRAAMQIVGGAALDDAHNYTRSNVTQYTKAHNVCQDSGDVAAFYVGQDLNRGQTWNQLTMDSVSANVSMTDWPPNAFYADNNAANQNISNCNATNIQSTTVRNNNSGGGLNETNCSWNGGFLVAGMAPDIGLYTSFPY